MAAYFSSCRTVAEVKTTYHKLALRHHPDRGGDTATMQEINAQYQQALRRCDGQTSMDETQQEHTYHYNQEREQAVVDFIDKLIRSGALRPTVDCWLIGTWVWIQGDTRPVKDILKSLGCQWHSKRACWYWHPADTRSRYNSKVGLDGIAATYGASKIVGKQSAELEAA